MEGRVEGGAPHPSLKGQGEKREAYSLSFYRCAKIIRFSGYPHYGPQSFNALVFALREKRHEVLRRPKEHMHTQPVPRSNAELLAPKIPTSVETAMLRQSVHKEPLHARLIMVNRGVQLGATLLYLLTEVGLKPASAALILATKAQASSPQSASLRHLLPCPLSNSIQNNHENMQRIQQKEFKKNSIPGSQNSSSERPSCIIVSRCQKLPTQKTFMLTGS